MKILYTSGGHRLVWEHILIRSAEICIYIISIIVIEEHTLSVTFFFWSMDIYNHNVITYKELHCCNTVYFKKTHMLLLGIYDSSDSFKTNKIGKVYSFGFQMFSSSLSSLTWTGCCQAHSEFSS
jgi:hypothetical protein